MEAVAWEKPWPRNSLKEGALVAITGRNQERLEQAKAEIEQFDGQVLCVPMDVREPQQVQQMVVTTKNTFGTIDYLVNNAAGNFICPAEDLSINGWNAVVNTVLNGTWYCTQAVGKEWIASHTKGSILNIIATYAWTAGAGVIRLCQRESRGAGDDEDTGR